MSIRPWLRFFRVPNLPTALGDAAAGSALAFAMLAGGEAPSDGVLAAFLAAAAAELLLYLFGLADNDIAGAESDARDAPDRPIPSGEISLRAARVARADRPVLQLGKHESRVAHQGNRDDDDNSFLALHMITFIALNQLWEETRNDQNHDTHDEYGDGLL